MTGKNGILGTKRSVAITMRERWPHGRALLALSGFQYDGPNANVVMLPRLPEPTFVVFGPPLQPGARFLSLTTRRNFV